MNEEAAISMPSSLPSQAELNTNAVSSRIQNAKLYIFSLDPLHSYSLVI